MGIKVTFFGAEPEQKNAAPPSRHVLIPQDAVRGTHQGKKNCFPCEET